MNPIIHVPDIGKFRYCENCDGTGRVKDLICKICNGNAILRVKPRKRRIRIQGIC